jgi:hypothetical protein
MLRRIIIALCGAAISFGVGCTASDREYMRNHVVETSSKSSLIVAAERTAPRDR